MRILLAIDDLPDPTELVETITSQDCPPDTMVRVLSVMAKGVSSPTSSTESERGTEQTANKMTQRAHEMTARIADALRANGLTADALVRFGQTQKVIVDEARNWLADLIVFAGYFDSPIHGWVADSTARWVVNHSPCLVKVVSMAK